MLYWKKYHSFCLPFALLLVLHTHNNTDGNKLMYFSGITVLWWYLYDNIHIWYQSVYVAVPDRSRILFRRVFQAHHWVWCAIALKFRKGWGSYTLCKCMDIWYVYKACYEPPPAPIGSLALQRVKLGDALEIRDAIIFDFYPGLPHIVLLKVQS